ncbi:MAG: hypothetical protein AB6733_12210 [Clostridiaceae bacterium]
MKRVMNLILVALVSIGITGCGNSTTKTESTKSETTAPKSEVAKTEKNIIKTDAFVYAKKVDITEAIDITKHVTATVFMSDELTPGLAVQHVLNQSYNFLQQAELKGADTVTIGVMKGDIRVFQYTVTMKKFVPNDSVKMSDVVLTASKVEKMTPQVEEFAKVTGWTILK